MGLFKFKSPRTLETTTGAERIDSGADLIVPENPLVNVVLDYAWTSNPKSSRKDVPYIYLIERKLTNDVMIQQLIYNLTAAYETGSQLVPELVSILQDKIKTKEGSASSLNVDKTNDALLAKAKTESAYAGLYALEDTGWRYVLPYFDKQHHAINGTWATIEGSETGFSGMATDLSKSLGEVSTDINRVMSALGSLTGTSDMVRPGTYIEQAKQYTVEAAGASYTVEFNLYNTSTTQDVINNWELCFAMMYNLLPNRRTKTVFDPPPLYEVFIPGVRRSPVSYIKGIQINFLGSTRIMDLDVAGQTKLRTIVPDAYSVKIDIEDVLPESKNFMQSMVDETKKVSVTRVTTQSLNYNVDDQIKTKSNDITYIGLNKPVGEFSASGISKVVKGAKNAVTNTIKKAGKVGSKIIKGGF